MRVFIDEAKATKEEGYSFQVTSRNQPVTARGATLQAKLVAFFSADTATALAGATKAREVTIRGVIKKAALEGSGRTVVLKVTLADARLQ